tara:strand:+ start:2363 stop:3280 length:918 start_codon:yes stop_codon:yes gene_type:complete
MPLCCRVISENCGFLCSYVKTKFRDDLLTGTEHSIKISPDCNTPIKSLSMIQGSPDNDEKLQIVLSDPKFGMFTLMKYHLTKGYKNEILKKKNAFYCSHIFSLLAFLPILVFISQWSIYIALVANELDSFDGEYCPNRADWKKKLTMFASCLIYFIRSFFLWDNLTDRTRLRKMIPSTSLLVMLDTFQEFGFNLFVYMANLWIVFVEDDLLDMILNCLAMEFLMNLDNEFEEMYFHYLPEAAIDIYDNLFVNYYENQQIINKRNKSCMFKFVHCLSWLPFKLVLLSLLFFPIICLFSMIYLPICK